MNEKKVCKYCGSELKKIQLPYDSDYLVEYFYVCFNDDCGYYVRGWNWMIEKFNVKCSYRYRYNPFTEDEGPIAVNSPNTWRDSIVE